jgi:hypothetical protein
MNILFKNEHMLISSQDGHIEKIGSHHGITDLQASNRTPAFVLFELM